MKEQAKNNELDRIRALLIGDLSYLKERYKVKEIGIFGSFIREEQGEDSDIDILVEFYEKPSLLRFIEIENHLSDLFERKVDLVLRDALKPRIGKRILEEVIYI